MLAVERRRIIVELVRAERSVKIPEVAEKLGVSPETVRRDIDSLDKSGQIRKVRGGAVRARNFVQAEPSFPDRQLLATAEKQGIALEAIHLLDGAKTIFLDLGTTATALAHELVRTFQGTVVTPSLRVAEVLSASREITVLVPGGIVRAGDMSVSGPQSRAFLAEIYPDVAFIGTGGVDAEAGITDFELIEVETKRIVIENSDRSYALADSSKLGVRGPYLVCDAGAVDAIITDGRAAASVLQEFSNSDISVVVGGGAK